MEEGLHVVLGAAGTMGRVVIDELRARDLKFRAVVRNKEIEGVEAVKADLLDLKQTEAAVNGAGYVYLCVGIPYRSEKWMEEWPKVMENVITVCEKESAKLIYLDNVYMYGPSPLKVPFDENHSQNPDSQKGKARKMTVDLLTEAMRSGRVNAVIGRSADFYGPNAVNSPFYTSFLDRMLQGKAPMFIGSVDEVHTYSYTPDNARALVTLALDGSAYGQVWHLPVSEPVTVKEAAGIINRELGTGYNVKAMSGFLLGILGLFIPILKELKEMLYQFNSPYIMSCDKFKEHYPDFAPVSFETGMREMIRSFQK